MPFLIIGFALLALAGGYLILFARINQLRSAHNRLAAAFTRHQRNDIPYTRRRPDEFYRDVADLPVRSEQVDCDG